MKALRFYLLSFSCFIGLIFFQLNNTMAAPPPGMPPVAVTAQIAKLIHWRPVLHATGTLVAEQGLVIKSEVAGRISKIFFRSGQTVKKGDPLVQLNPDVLLAQLKQYEAELTLNKMAYERNHGLLQKNVVSQAEFDQVLSNYQSSEAKVEGAKAQLQQLLITAPFSGKVGLQQVNLGDYVDAGANIVNLQSIDPIYVDFSVPEMDLSNLQLGQPVRVVSAAYPNEKFWGRVFAMESLIDPDTRTLKVRAILPNKAGHLIPGGFVEVLLPLSQLQTVISIPQTAIFNAPDGSEAVYVVKNNQAVLTKVTILKQRANHVLIASGLAAGDQVVTAGQMKLQDQAPVQISNQ